MIEKSPVIVIIDQENKYVNIESTSKIFFKGDQIDKNKV